MLSVHNEASWDIIRISAWSCESYVAENAGGCCRLLSVLASFSSILKMRIVSFFSALFETRTVYDERTPPVSHTCRLYLTGHYIPPAPSISRYTWSLFHTSNILWRENCVFKRCFCSRLRPPIPSLVPSSCSCHHRGAGLRACSWMPLTPIAKCRFLFRSVPAYLHSRWPNCSDARDAFQRERV